MLDSVAYGAKYQTDIVRSIWGNERIVMTLCEIKLGGG